MIFVNSNSNNESHLHVFRCKQDNEFVSDEEMSREFGHNYILPCSQSTFKADNRNAKKRIVKHRKNNVIDRSTVKTEPSFKTALYTRMQ